ncbi:hypothetical protein, partial [Sulfitobacter noctilucae]|uniref:hypothetical protein n=1 Tax=Sulfitobacter noctilucae TaxID=1342302 RepID=UPI000469381E
MSKIIFDVTDLRKYIAMHPHLSGIQRVMVMIIDELAAQIGNDDIWLGYCGDAPHEYHVRPYKALGTAGMSDIENLAVVLHQSRSRPMRPSMQAYADRPVKRFFHTLLRDHRARNGDVQHFIKRGTTIEAWRASAPALADGADLSKPQSLFDICGPGDWMVMLDAGWADKSWQSADNWRHRLRAKGVRIALLVHDLIQIQNPEYIPGTDSKVFYQWLHSTLETADVYLANSQATADDLNAFLQEYKATQTVHVLPLAQHPLKAPPTDMPKESSVDPDMPYVPPLYAKFDETWDMNG